MRQKGAALLVLRGRTLALGLLPLLWIHSLATGSSVSYGFGGGCQLRSLGGLMTRDAPYESEAFGDPSRGHLCRLTLQLLCSSEALGSGLRDNRGTRCTDIFSSLHPSAFPNGELGFLGKKLHSLRKMEI